MNEIRIAASVGENAKNNYCDVRTIQKALNQIVQQNILVPLGPLKEDGIAGRNTKLAIRQFQRVSLAMAAPDGRIDVGGKTLKQLNALIEATGKLNVNSILKANTCSSIKGSENQLASVFQQFNRIQYGLLAGVITHKAQALNVSSNTNSDLRTLSKSEFVKQVFEEAKKEATKSEIPAAVTTAQAILETGYGKSVPTDMNTKQYSYNLFGIKGIGTAGSVTVYTHEVINGKRIKILDKFQAYHSFSESISGRTKFLTKNKRYKHLFDITDPKKWAEGLQKAVYATDPNYAKLLITIMTSWKLI
ncbi:MAG: glucosaminidase domain-containing protein [Pseudomonadota bacterium]